MVLNICSNYRRFGNAEIAATEETDTLIQDGKLIINYAADMGALTKLYPTIQYINDNFSTYKGNIDIITIDDDCRYKSDLVQILMDKAESTNREKVIGFFGFNFNDKCEVTESITPSTMQEKGIEEQEIDIVGGANGF